MSKNLYVGNLSYAVTDAELNQLFSQFGKVDSARVITDRDTCIAVAGAPRRDLVDKRLSERLESVLEGRKIYQVQPGDPPMAVSEESGKFFVSCAAPILAEGDVLGCVLFAAGEGETASGDTEYKLLQTMSGFLGRHMES